MKILIGSLMAFLGLNLIYSCAQNEKPKQGHDNMQMQNVDESAQVHLSEKDLILGNIRTDTARMKIMTEGVNMLGTAAIDEYRVTVISARLYGRIERLYFRNPGAVLGAGKPMYDIYSEELAAAERYFLDLLSQSSSELPQSLLSSTKEKLKLWGLTEGQIHRLEKTKSPSPYITIYSRAEGYITELNITEGQYVDKGTTLFKLADLSEVWVEAQLYAGEVKYIKQSPKISIQFEGIADRTYVGQLVYSNPALEPNSYISLTRYAVKNPDLRVKPGMIAYLTMQKNSSKTLSVPKDAVTDYNNMPVVWAYRGNGHFVQKMVKTGRESADDIEILSGIKPGEIIAVSGAYLINSEYTVKAGAGAGMEGMKM